MAVRHQTNNYKLETERGGLFVTLTRADGKSAFFQGDDAVLWDDNMTALENIDQWNVGNSLDKSFNCLCSDYDDVLEAA